MLRCCSQQPACCEQGQSSSLRLFFLHRPSRFTRGLHPCAGEGGRGWAPQHALGGHHGAVVDMGWDAEGRCLHTVSEDQTARIFSTCHSHWCEIARPQVGHRGSRRSIAPHMPDPGRPSVMALAPPPALQPDRVPLSGNEGR